MNEGGRNGGDRRGGGAPESASEAGPERVLRDAGGFVLRILGDFRRNQGLLLAGAVAYYTLLSIVPLFALLLIALSHFLSPQQLLRTIAAYTELLVPDYTPLLIEQLSRLIEHREVVGRLGIVFLLFFSSLAFTALENAMSVIFFHRVTIHRRHFLISAIIPYLYILLLGAGILLVTLMSGALQGLEGESVTIFRNTWTLGGASATMLYVLGFVGLILMLTSLYLVMPVGQLRLRHALIGGVTAAVLWEITRHLLVWYYSTLSLVDVVYGTLATAIVALVSLEFAALILLLGAQVIAEFERRHEVGRGRWPHDMVT
jgi:membrane protein